MTYWQMYLITRLDVILIFAALTMAFSGILLLTCVWGYYAIKPDLEDKLQRAKEGDVDVPDVPKIERDLAEIKKGIVSAWILFGSVFVISAATLLCLPSEKSMYKIIIVPKIVNNETIRSDYKELYDLAVDALKEKLKGDRR